MHLLSLPFAVLVEHLSHLLQLVVLVFDGGLEHTFFNAFLDALFQNGLSFLLTSFVLDVLDQGVHDDLV